ncbi:MAG: AsmA family protein, partial [Sulfurimonas sp.]|nr:AsmA family protein [Sulfurimonas sp.]
MFKKIALSFLALYSLLGFFVLPLIVKSQIIDIVEQKTNAKLLINDVYFNPFIFNLQISGVKLSGSDGEHLVSLKSIQIDLELYSLLRSAIHINNIIVDEPKISVVYNKDKTFNFSTLLKEGVTEEESLDESTDQKMQMPRVIVDLIKINSGGVDYEDFTNSKKFDFSLHSIGFELKDIDTNDF